MTRKIFTGKGKGGGTAFLSTGRLQALLLAVLLAVTSVFGLAACGSKREETEANLTEASATDAEVEAGSVSETDGTDETAEEATGEVSDENAENGTDDAGDAEETDTGNKNGTGDADAEDGSDAESTSVLDDTTKAVSVTETTAGAESETADANGYTYTSMSDTILYVKQQANVRSIPSKDGDKLGSLSAGTPVTVTGQCNETSWYRIAFNGTSGYVSNNYLTASKSEVSTTKASSESSTTKSGSESSTTTKKSSESSTTTKKSTETTTTKKKTSYSTMTEKYEAEGLENFTSAELKQLCAEYAEEVVRLVNVERAKEDLVALKENSLLMEAAQTRAEEIATYYEHDRPDGTSCFTVFRDVGFLSTEGGENIAYGQMTPAWVMESWMNSAGHRANIMNQTITLNSETYEITYVNYYVKDIDGIYYGCGYDSIGVGVYYEASSQTFYWVQLFGRSHTHTWEDSMTNGESCLTCFSMNCGAHKWADGTITNEMSWID